MKRAERYIPPLCIIINVLLVVAAFAKFSLSEKHLGLFFSSDSIYLPSLYKDLFVDGNTLEGWHLNPAPNFFPDMLFYFVLMAFSNSFIVSSFLFPLFQYLLIAYLLFKLFKVLFAKASVYFCLLINLLLAFFLLEILYFSQDFEFSFNILTNSYHLGCFVMTLVCFLIALNYIAEPRPYRLFLLFFLIFLATLSDRMFTVSFVVPALFTILIFRRSILIWKANLLFVACLLGFMIGWSVFDGLSHGDYVFFPDPPKLFNFENAPFALTQYTSQIYDLVLDFGFRQLSIIAFIISVVTLVYLLVKTARGGPVLIKFYALFCLSFSAMLILTPIVNGIYTSYDFLRYSIPVFYLFPLHLSVFIAWRFGAASLTMPGKLFLILSAISLLYVSYEQIRSKGLESYFGYYPATARQLDSIFEKKPLFCGVGNYWDAKKTTMFSKKGVKVYAAYDDISLYHHVSNQKWFYGNNIFNFVLFNNFKDTTFIARNLRPIKLIIDNKDLKLMEVSPFRYKKENIYSPITIGDK